MQNGLLLEYAVWNLFVQELSHHKWRLTVPQAVLQILKKDKGGSTSAKFSSPALGVSARGVLDLLLCKSMRSLSCNAAASESNLGVLPLRSLSATCWASIDELLYTLASDMCLLKGFSTDASARPGTGAAETLTNGSVSLGVLTEFGVCTICLGVSCRGMTSGYSMKIFEIADQRSQDVKSQGHCW